MNLDFKWGIIGTGGIANAFANDLQNLKGHRVKAVASRTKLNATTFSAKFDGCVAYHHYDDFINDPDIDGVYIASPNHLHLEHTLLALGAGKPVLCEKPFAINAEEVQKMIDSSKKNKTLLMEAMWSRFLPHMKAVRSIVGNGDLGEIHTIRADHGQNLTHIKNPRLWNLEYGGGALLDLGIYVVSFAHLILGKPDKIIASSTFNKDKIDLQTSAIFKYKTGAQAILNTTMINSTPCRAIISGDKGWLEINPIFYAPTSFKVILLNGERKEYSNKYTGHGLREQAIEFAACIDKGFNESPILSHDESLQIMSTMDKIRKLIGLNLPMD